MPNTSESSQPKILVFDSGVGGLSILQAISSRLPDCHYVYASDNAGFPYGTREEKDLVHRVDKVLKALINRVEPDIVVIACNSASTVALPKIRSHFTKPVVGVVPAIKPAAAISTSKVIGLLGTPGTVQRAYTRQLISDFASDCEVISVGSSELVEIAESKLRGISPNQLQLKEILQPFSDTELLDTVVLACTHFPLLTEELRTTLPGINQWVDSGEAIARRVASLLQLQFTAPAQDKTAPFTAILTTETNTESLQLSLKNMGALSVSYLYCH